ncbi:restriction endonuclease subunit S [Staphylococcus aureus]|jgi:Restriction endonuclease S subunits|uniref:Type I restriction-modification system specificity subunit n=12 Tax=Staphylococcus aureus TaxID=1280 RepID=A0AAN1ZPP8_STAAU|nr:restriction endonuclease subunit S [Staphylococcus aureus]EGS89252.1 type I restriction modification DNA specificity domain protein [Staphylococcus aureus subsp. aureus 21259]MRF33484.1 restriction endonuclease subunit S [Staphylococcus sp. KY49P]HAR4233299.1 restriction endonuclease subunit S [Staphylococcus aureus ADL-206]HDT6672511.1 restriction endonuclease subunit S [Staphylococcus aureus M0274]AGU60552.1 Type I restriction-modification system specificity subunit [Staphylococcus aureus
MSNTQKKNVPELRFPGFEGEWEEKKLGEVAKIYDGTHQTPKYTNEGIKFLSVENIKTLNSSKYISEEAFEKEFKIRPEFGDILMTRIGDIGTPNIVSSNEKFAYYVSLALLKTKNLNSYFLKNLILSSSIQNELWRKTLHVAFPKKINKNEIGKIKINYPKKQEQQKIGQFFSKLDRQIELEEQKLELLQQQKKGYMQKIFSQELRFKDENGNDYPEWEERRFADIFKFHNKLRKPIKENLRVKGSYPYYGATGIIDYVDDFIFDGNYLLIGEDGANIITRSAPLVYLVNGKFWVNNHAHILSPLNGNIQYLYQVAELVNYEKYNTGTAQPKLNIQNLKIISVVISTNLEEQQKIGSFLSKLDRQIDLEEQKLELLQQRKKALLKLMFV